MSKTNNNEDLKSVISNSLQSWDAVQTIIEKTKVNYEVLAYEGKYIYCKSNNWEAAW